MSFIAHHARAMRAAKRRLAASLFGTLLNVFVIGIALALPFGSSIVLDHLRGTLHHFEDNTPQFSVFMDLDASRAAANAIEQKLNQDKRIAQVRFVPREQALQALKANSGLDDVINSLTKNPLPDAFVVAARASLSDNAPADFDALRDDIARWPNVAHVQFDSAWARKLDALLKVGRYAAMLLGILLATALIAIVFNTIRLQLLTQRDEIEVASLIGATDAYIRRPFLYFGAGIGLLGGIAAWLMTVGSFTLLNHQLGDLSLIYATPVRLALPALRDSLALFAIAALLGWIGAWLSVTRNLAQLESDRK